MLLPLTLLLFHAATSDTADEPTRILTEWQDWDTAGHRFGAPDARVTIVFFSDFYCTYCRGTHQLLHEVLEEFPAGDLAMLLRHRPLQSAPSRGYDMAIGAECADGQGQFDDFHRLAFMLPWAGRPDPVDVATSVGIPDLEVFRECLREPEAKRRVEADLAAVERLGLPGTPILVVGSEVLYGAPSKARLVRTIRLALSEGTK